MNDTITILDCDRSYRLSQFIVLVGDNYIILQYYLTILDSSFDRIGSDMWKQVAVEPEKEHHRFVIFWYLWRHRPECPSWRRPSSRHHFLPKRADGPPVPRTETHSDDVVVLMIETPR